MGGKPSNRERSIMSEKWIVAADSSRARIFSEETAGKPWQEVKEFLHPESRTHESGTEIEQARRTFKRESPGRHAVSENISPKEHEAWKLCRKIASEVDNARAQNRFNGLVLIAAPAVLGELRKRLSPPTVKRVIQEMPKNLVQRRTEEIRQHLEQISADASDSTDPKG